MDWLEIPEIVVISLMLFWSYTINKIPLEVSFEKKKQMGWTHQTITINSTSGIHEDSGKPKTLKKSVGGDSE